MPDLKEITRLPVENELHTCPDCGYTLGFHISFVSTNAGRDNPAGSNREVYRVILICPECGARYDVGWHVSFAESESRSEKAPVNTATCAPHGSPAACLPPLPHVTSTRQNNTRLNPAVMAIHGPAMTVRVSLVSGVRKVSL